MLDKQRKYGLGIWGLGLGYFLFYTPYSGLTKALSSGILPGVQHAVRGTVLLPISIAAVAIGMLSFITVMNWWQYAGHRKFLGINIPFPRRQTFLSGICMATIMGTTTIVFTFEGISIVLVLVLLRGGVLIIAPLVDSLARRRVRWFSWGAMLVSLLAVAVALVDATSYHLTLPAIATIAAYLGAYFIKLQLMSSLAKTDDRSVTLRYFVEEQMIASPLLLLVLVALAAVGVGDAMIGFRIGLTTFLVSKEAIFALLVGLCYAGLCVCTTLIFLDRRENTFCVPMHCGSSMLSGLAATFILTFVSPQVAASGSQLISAGLIVLALALLSPLHHFQRVYGKLKSALNDMYSLVPGFGTALETRDPVALSFQANLSPVGSVNRLETGTLTQIEKRRTSFLFVCSGNTCRSPMAAAIGNAELAARFRLTNSVLDAANLAAGSAGISASIGAPMAPEAQQALRLLGVPVVPHSARNLTAELAHQVEKIFCMTQAHRNAVINLVPAASTKTLCLDPHDDVEDPIGKGLAAYVSCARRIQSLIRMRFDETGLAGEYGPSGD